MSNSNSSGRIKAGTIAAFSMATIPVGALTTPLLVHLPPHYAGLLGLPLAAVGGIFFLVKVLDLIFDPAFGLLMDRTRTPIGRYRFWLIVAAPVLMLGVWQLFLAKPGVSQLYLLIWLSVLYVGFSLLVLSQSAWGAVLATNYDERSRVYAWASASGTFGAIAVLILPLLLKLPDTEVVPFMGWMIVLSIPITTLIVAFGVKEPVVPRREAEDRLSWRDFPALIARPTMARLLGADLLFTLGPAITSPLYLFFFIQARGYTLTEANIMLLFFIVAGIFGAPLWAMAAYRFGKHRTLMAGAAAYSVAQALIFFIPSKTFWLMAPAMFLAGGILASLAFLIRAMVADVGDEVRHQTGKDRVGLLYALVSSTSKIGTASAVLVTFAILDWVGFNAAPGAVNSGEAMNGLVMTYAIAPVVLVMAGAFAVRGYSLNRERHDGIRADLDARDAAAIAGRSAAEAVSAAPTPAVGS
ncbi:MAG: MFS transporter [Caulobacter sp.]|nr:MFS transporter [Caulobacter sp.]